MVGALARKLGRDAFTHLRHARKRRRYARRVRTSDAWGGFLQPAGARPINPVSDGAVELLGYRFDLTDGRTWDYSPDRDWRWGKRFCTAYDLADPAAGDYKLIWELGRLQFLPGLLADRPDEGAAVLAGYLEYDEPLRTIHWYSEMEIGIRMISLMLCLPFLEGSDGLRRRTLESIRVHYRYLCDHLTTWWTVRNNHVLVEVTALLAYEMLFVGDHPEHGRRWEILLGEAREQIFADGGIREQATGYARFNLDAFLLLWLLCERTGAEVPAELKDVTETMLDHMAALQGSAGLWPQVGDGDDGRVIPQACDRDWWDFGGHLAIGAVLCDRGDFKTVAGRWDNDFAWLLDEEYARRFDELPAEPRPAGARLLADSGYWVWRSGSGPESDALLLRAGEFGLGGDNGAPHSHCDELSILWTLAGEAVLVDSGTFTYDRHNEDWRRAFRANSSHNILTVDDWPQAYAPPGANFCWGRVPTARIDRAGEEFAEATFDDYDDRYTWRRRVQVEPGRVAMVDHVRLAASADRHLAWTFNFAPGVTVEIAGGEVIGQAGGVRFRLGSANLPAGAAWRIEAGWYSQRYNRREQIQRAVLSADIRDECEVEWTIESIS